ncbi:hypothetical protein C8F01DRAFT_1274671 [Mycena amicta]|nr:hypothetical protein C8F01DRAFT_1274671 [Mycena amicta]
MLLSPHSLPSSTHSRRSSSRNLAHDLVTALLAIARLPGTVLAAATNTTFDDTQSSFSWSGSWNAITPAAPCPGCYSQPDPSQIHNGTWHDGHASGMDSPTFGSFTFTGSAYNFSMLHPSIGLITMFSAGSAVYIFGIDQTGVEADIVFELILRSSGRNITSTHHYTGSPLGGGFVYSTPYFSATDLPEDTYTVNWILNLDPASDTQIQVALIDYAVVTTGDSDVPMASRVTGGPSVKPPLPTLNASHSSSHVSGARSSSSLIATSSTSPSTIDLNTPETTPSTSAASGPRQPTAARLHLGTIIGVSLGSSALVIAVLVVWRYLRKQSPRLPSASNCSSTRSR